MTNEDISCIKVDADQLSEEDFHRLNLITRNLQEVLGMEKIIKQLASKKVFMCTGARRLLESRMWDIFWELLDNRVLYYEKVIKALLTALNVPLDQLHFVRGTSYQLKREYTSDVLRLCNIVTRRDALRAGAEVVKQVASPLLSGLLYPLLQALDEQYLKVDGQFGGVDQRKIFILAEEQLPKLKLGKRFHLLNPMVPGLQGSKMSSSEENSKIDLLDKADIVQKKIDSAICNRNSNENGVLAFYEHVLFPIILPKTVSINGKNYDNYQDLFEEYNTGKISEADLKETVKCGVVLLSFGILRFITFARHTSKTGTGLHPCTEKLYGQRNAIVTRKRIFQNISDDGLPHSLNTAVDDVILNEAEDQRFREIICDAENNKLHIVYMIAPKGRFHLGFVIPLFKLKKLQLLGNVSLTIVLADIDAFWIMRNVHGMLEKHGVITILRSCNREYTLEVYQLASKVTRDEASILNGVTLGSLLLPLYFTIDLYRMNVDIIVTGEEMRPFSKFSEQMIQRCGQQPRAHLLLPVLPSMSGSKMSASDPEFHLDLLDTSKHIKQKITRSFCEPCSLKNNIAFELAKHFIFSYFGSTLVIKRSEENGGNMEINGCDELERIIVDGSLHPADLKAVVISKINEFCDPIRTCFVAKTKLISAAFPSKKVVKIAFIDSLNDAGVKIVNGDDNSKLSVGKHHLSGTIPRRLKDQRSDADIRRLQGVKGGLEIRTIFCDVCTDYLLGNSLKLLLEKTEAAEFMESLLYKNISNPIKANITGSNDSDGVGNLC
ncbi:Tyrosine--tRNA ligase [Dirofilaria immitis]|nr:Tyrosine--tRNA ligase [Dirofilaria immitis]